MVTRFRNKGLDRGAIPNVLYALVVDDEPLILMHTCDIPEGAGLRFHEAGSGEEATFLGDHADNVTLLFSDVEMPSDTDGFELAHYVAKNWRWIEIVIASGNVKPCPGGHARQSDVHRQAFQRSHAPATYLGGAAGQQTTRAPQASSNCAFLDS